ncbi:MAG: HAD-IC family P-type ATPase [Flavobacteriales bacterium]|nr:HAD-IC family P-type ATPase [Flavobacteriales bacterium]
MTKSKSNKHKQDIYSWHSIDEKKIKQILFTNQNGLDEQEALKRIDIFGKNTLPISKKVTLGSIILHQLINPLIFILIAASIASILIGEAEDSFFIFLVIIINSTLGAYQEYRAEKSAESLQRLMKIKARVIRNGRTYETDSENLVPGDWVELESGQKVPADIRLFDAQYLEVDESFLTGESIASIKNISLLPENTAIAERKNMVFAGSTIIAGRGAGVVVNTGSFTQVGNIARDVSDSKSAQPPLLIRMSRFIRQISIFILSIGILIGIYLWWQGMALSDIFFFIVAMSVSAIPEGLPVALTVALSIAAKRMSNRNVIVRKLAAVESLGSCTVIASDKTGTLTVNEQTARMIILPDGKKYEVTGEGYNGIGDVLFHNEKITVQNQWNQALNYLHRIAVLANEANLTKINHDWSYHGDSRDVALVALAYKLGTNAEELRKTTQVLDTIPYESEKKYAGCIVESDGVPQLYIKGAVETVLKHCNFMVTENGNSLINKEYILHETHELAKQGYRVLAFAWGNWPSFKKSSVYFSEDFPSLCFTGLVAFIDPLRKEAKAAIETCKKAGIRVIMITGDHPATALTIAKDLGITDETQQAISGDILEKLGKPGVPVFDETVLKSRVFARVTPHQKLQIVDVLINKGEFVAVTGDGVNDAPALKRANIGVAMGSGTDVAKETGEMIVVDDNFSSIVAGVEEGRYAYDNVRKVIYLLISTGAAEVLMFVAAIITGLPLPLLPVQLLWLNLVTNGIQDVALAFEKGEPGTMLKKPRKPSEKIFNPLMIKQTITSSIIIGGIVFFLWYWLLKVVGMNEYHSRDMVLLLMVFMQNFHVFNCRSETNSAFKIPLNRNWFLIGGVIIAQGLHIISMHIPFMQHLLKIEPITIHEWVGILFLAIPILLGMEIFKWIYKKNQKQII